MERSRMTDDGSVTLFSEKFNQYYHSVRGAFAETNRVYIELGLLAKMQDTTQFSILEMGFGTGLNALMTALESQKNALTITYTTLEAFPISASDTLLLNYATQLETDLFLKIQVAEWQKMVKIGKGFSLKKIQTTLENFETDQQFDVIYYDAFAPSSQPELWTVEIFSKLFNITAKGGFLTTYCSKTVVRKAIEAAGFRVEKHAGPYGKRDVLRAVKD